MIKIWVDQFLIFIKHPNKLPYYLDSSNFQTVLIPRNYWKIVHPILTKKGFIISRVQLIEGEAYDEWVCET